VKMEVYSRDISRYFEWRYIVVRHFWCRLSVIIIYRAIVGDYHCQPAVIFTRMVCKCVCAYMNWWKHAAKGSCPTRIQKCPWRSRIG